MSIASIAMTVETPDGRVFSGELGTIKEAHLGFEDHGVMSMNLDFDFGSSGQGTGHYILSERDATAGRQIGRAEGMDLLVQITAMFGPWHELKGKRIIVLRAGDDTRGMILGLMNEHTREFLILKDAFEEAKGIYLRRATVGEEVL